MIRNPSLTDANVRHLLDAIRPEKHAWTAKKKAVRLKTVFLLMLDAGLRVGEVTRLKWDDVYFLDLAKNPLFVPQNVAKRAHERYIPLSNALSTQLDIHETVWAPRAAPFDQVYLIHNVDPRKPMSPRSVQTWIAKLGQEVLGIPIWPHLLRHTFANRLRRQTDLPTLQSLLGHKHLSSTQVYTAPNDDDRTKAIHSLDQPDGEPV